MAVCYNYLKQINDLVDNEIDPSELKELQSHLQQCTECSEYLESTKTLKASFSAMLRYKTSDSFDIVLRENLRNELKQEKAFPPSLPLNFSFFNFNRKPAFAMAAIVVVIAGLFISRNLVMQNKSSSPLASDDKTLTIQTQKSSLTPATNSVANEPYIKVKNYVNVREQFNMNPRYIRQTEQAGSQQRRLESDERETDSLQSIPRSTFNKPLVRQANYTVHF